MSSIRNWVPDWVFYLLALVLLIGACRLFAEKANAPEAPPILPDPATNIAAASPFDPQITVETGPAESAIGTAFAISLSGVWLTARHVVEDCTSVGLEISPGRISPVNEVRSSPDSDLAVLRTTIAPRALQLRLDEGLKENGQGYHFGFPQNQPGEAASRLIGRHIIASRGRFEYNAPVLTWAEIGRTRGLFGSLSGISGGPAFDDKGRVVGVTVAESLRRGRVYTASPSSIERFVSSQKVSLNGSPAGPVSADTYGFVADQLRHELAVTKVVCYVS